MPVLVPAPGTATATNIEVFSGDHRWQNRYARFTNGLLRYTIDTSTPGDPLIEVWNSGAWTSCGGYRIQSWSGSVYTPLQQRSFYVQTTSPDEIYWEEQRYDASATAMVRILNRIRRGSRLIESQIISYSGQPLTGAQSIGFASGPAAAVASSADATGCVGTGSSTLPGFCYINGSTATASVSAGGFWCGLSIAAGAMGRLSLLAGLQDAQYTSLGTAALYAGHWAAVNRMRVKQFIMLNP